MESKDTNLTAPAKTDEPKAEEQDDIEYL